MKNFVAVLGVLVATAAFGTRAEAQNYPWCAYYAGGVDGGVNCGFVTVEQCRATVSGIGGFCMPNTQYQPAYPGSRHKAGPKSHTYS